MVIFTDGLFPGPGAFVSPTAPCQLPWGYQNHNPSGLEEQCQAVLKALLALLCPIPTAGQLALLPPTLPLCSSTCLGATLPPGVPQPPAARPPSALPWDHPLGLPLSVSWGCVPARAHMNGAANSAPGACWGGDKLCCAVLSCTRMVPLSSVLVSSTQQVSTVFFPVGVVLFNLHVTEQTSVGLWVW